jgi:hypothetical protein
VTPAPFSLENVVLIVHVGSVVIAFGMIFAYPLFVGLGNSIIDPGGLPPFHRAQVRVIRWLVGPGLAIVAVSGLVLAAKLGTLTRFYSDWGIIAAIAIGCILGGYLAPREARLAAIAATDLQAEDGVLSLEYDELSHRVLRMSQITSAIVLATILVMAAHS